MGCNDSYQEPTKAEIQDLDDGPRVACALADILAVDPNKFSALIVAAKIDWRAHSISARDLIRWVARHRKEDAERRLEEMVDKVARERAERAELRRLQKKFGR